MRTTLGTVIECLLMKNLEFFILQTYSFPEVSEFVVYSYLFSYAALYSSDLLNRFWKTTIIKYLDGSVFS